LLLLLLLFEELSMYDGNLEHLAILLVGTINKHQSETGSLHPTCLPPPSRVALVVVVVAAAVAVVAAAAWSLLAFAAAGFFTLAIIKFLAMSIPTAEQIAEPPLAPTDDDGYSL
jgi:hypothetical protein